MRGVRAPAYRCDAPGGFIEGQVVMLPPLSGEGFACGRISEF